MPTGKRVSSDVYRKEPETTEARGLMIIFMMILNGMRDP
jgi:hypothetical protein